MPPARGERRIDGRGARQPGARPRRPARAAAARAAESRGPRSPAGRTPGGRRPPLLARRRRLRHARLRQRARAPAPDLRHPPVTGRVRVLIADDQPLFTHALAAILADDERIEVVGSAPDGGAAVELAAEIQPDIVVMDISMPRVDGLE